MIKHGDNVRVLEQFERLSAKSESLHILRGLFHLDTNFNPKSLTTNLSPRSIEFFTKYLGEPVGEIVQSAEFQRLTGVSQMIAKFTRGNAFQTSSRHLHSIQAAACAKFFAEYSVSQEAEDRFRNVGYDLTKLAVTTALLHDIAHPPFNHTGEKIIRIAFQRKDFDHDPEAKKVILDTPLRATLLKNKIDPEVVAHVIAEDREWFVQRKQAFVYDVLFNIKELADRVSYLTCDLSSDPARYCTVYNFGHLNSIINDVSIGSNGLSLSDKEASSLSHIRFNHFQANTFNPYVLLAKEILYNEFKKVAKSERLSYQDFVKLDEGALLTVIDPLKASELLSGLESHYLASFSIPVSSLDISKINSERGLHALRKQLRATFGETSSNGHLSSNNVYVVLEPAGSKTISYISKETGKTLDVTLSSKQSSRYLTVFSRIHSSSGVEPFDPSNPSFQSVIEDLRQDRNQPIDQFISQSIHNAALLRQRSFTIL